MMARSIIGSPSPPDSSDITAGFVGSQRALRPATPECQSTSNLNTTPTPSPTRNGLKRLIFAPTDLALTPRRRLGAVKAVSRSQREKRKSLWVGAGVPLDDERGEDEGAEILAQALNDLVVSNPAVQGHKLNEYSCTNIPAALDLGIPSIYDQCCEASSSKADTTDEEFIKPRARSRKTRIVESESEDEKSQGAPPRSALDSQHQSAIPADTINTDALESYFSGLNAYSRFGNLATNELISSEDEDAPPIVATRKAQPAKRIITSDSSSENSEGRRSRAVSGTGLGSSITRLTSARKDRIIRSGSDSDNLPSAYKPRPATKNQPRARIVESDEDEDLATFVDRLHVSGHGDPVIKKKGVGANKTVIVISDDEEDAEYADALDDYLLQYSPSPEKRPVELALSPPKQRSGKGKFPQVKGARATKKSWEAERVTLANELFDELDNAVFQGRLRGAGATIEWNKRLLTTAGTATDKRKRQANGEEQHTYTIKLSTKVLDEPERILSTVAHEMCHLATWIISGEYANPHGRVFQSWGRRVMRARPDIEVTTKHDYVIAYKYSWKCVQEDCGKIYGRQSKSIDITRHACGRCRSKLEPMFATKTTSAFQEYLKANMKNAKLAMPSSTFGDIMRELSARWKAGGEDHAAYWASRAHGYAS